MQASEEVRNPYHIKSKQPKLLMIAIGLILAVKSPITLIYGPDDLTQKLADLDDRWAFNLIYYLLSSVLTVPVAAIINYLPNFGVNLIMILMPLKVIAELGSIVYLERFNQAVPLGVCLALMNICLDWYCYLKIRDAVTLAYKDRATGVALIANKLWVALQIWLNQFLEKSIFIDDETKTFKWGFYTVYGISFIIAGAAGYLLSKTKRTKKKKKSKSKEKAKEGETESKAQKDAPESMTTEQQSKVNVPLFGEQKLKPPQLHQNIRPVSQPLMENEDDEGYWGEGQKNNRAMMNALKKGSPVRGFLALGYFQLSFQSLCAMMNAFLQIPRAIDTNLYDKLWWVDGTVGPALFTLLSYLTFFKSFRHKIFYIQILTLLLLMISVVSGVLIEGFDTAFTGLSFVLYKLTLIGFESWTLALFFILYNFKGSEYLLLGAIQVLDVQVQEFLVPQFDRRVEGYVKKVTGGEKGAGVGLFWLWFGLCIHLCLVAGWNIWEMYLLNVRRRAKGGVNYLRI